MPVTNILYSERRENYGYFDMEYCSEAVTYFNYIHSKSDEDNWDILRNVLERLNENLYDSSPCCINGTRFRNMWIRKWQIILKYAIHG